MFPEAPAPTVPISLIEDSDLDCLLIEFPNHLIVPTVMEHFCGPVGGNRSEQGYLAKKMVERLSVHRNLQNEVDFDAADRIEDLVAWIRKWKKVANAARRKRQAAGQNVELVPFQGQCIDLGMGHRERENTLEAEKTESPPTPLGLRLKQRFDAALREYQKMMVDWANQSTPGSSGDKALENT